VCVNPKGETTMGEATIETADGDGKARQRKARHSGEPRMPRRNDAKSE